MGLYNQAFPRSQKQESRNRKMGLRPEIKKTQKGHGVAFIFILEHPFSLDVWDPFKDFPFPSSLATRSPETSAFVNTRIDWKETPEAHVFKADLHGLKKEEVKVEVEDDRVLQISDERKIEKEDKNDTWRRVELSSGNFSRRFRLPENMKMDQVKAFMENGVLTVTVPKVEVKKPDVKTIDISG
ncbi:18.1 kDa class I heat shock protein-like [Hibiscus syriacus]|uniref:18.1 kDa class I heat shock protein-like n=1 Tax=Hibiscus syriacus TaxID=106335 RepID=UPI00192297F6|nr:18.1 kDa class I heat shock protein-like [Hibiscus syriacus]